MMWKIIQQFFCLHDDEIVDKYWLTTPTWREDMGARMGLIRVKRKCNKCGRKWTERGLEFESDDEFQRWMKA